MVVTSLTQPFYGIGLLKVRDVGPWVDELNRLVDRYIASVAKAGVQRARATYEFHFSKLTAGTRSFYDEMIDYFVSRPEGYFCALILDKNQPDVDPIAIYGDPWDALIGYSQMMLRNNIKGDERATVVSDYYQKPRRSAKYYERELMQALPDKLTNVAMMDSAASIMLQLVDVLLGCVMYHYKAPLLARVDAEKKAVADRLAAAYRVPTLAQNFTRNPGAFPNYFSVWQFRPKAPPGGRAGP